LGSSPPIVSGSVMLVWYNIESSYNAEPMPYSMTIEPSMSRMKPVDAFMKNNHTRGRRAAVKV